MARKLLLVTGPSGSGKTTLIQRLYDHYTERGVKVGGLVTREFRVGGERAGFKILDLATRDEGWLARKQGSEGPGVGRYRVDTRDLERIGSAALLKAARGDAQLALVDEIGPMEMTSQEFRGALSQLLASGKPIVATVRYDSHYPEVEEVRRTSDTRTIRITPSNRDSIPREIIVEVDGMLGLAGETQQ